MYTCVYIYIYIYMCDPERIHVPARALSTRLLSQLHVVTAGARGVLMCHVHHDS